MGEMRPKEPATREQPGAGCLVVVACVLTIAALWLGSWALLADDAERWAAVAAGGTAVMLALSVVVLIVGVVSDDDNDGNES